MEVIHLQPHVAPIYKITGTPASYQGTITDYNTSELENRATLEGGACSWVLLLDALQEQGRVSRIWIEDQQIRAGTIPSAATYRGKHAAGISCHQTLRNHSGLPRYLTWSRSCRCSAWFGQNLTLKASALTAEGNGYMVTSEYLLGTGIVVKFFYLSRSDHENRIIPRQELKRLCFGEVPSLFDALGQNLQVSPHHLNDSIARLLPDLSPAHRRLFSSSEMNAESFILSREQTVLLGLVLFTHLADHSLLATFEFISMVAKSVHIRGSKFRRIPNPCGDAPPVDLNIVAYLSAFATMLQDLSSVGTDRLATEVKNCLQHGRLDGVSVLPHTTCPLEQLITIHAAAESNYENEKNERFYCPAGEREARKESARDAYEDALRNLLDALHNVITYIDHRFSQTDMAEEVRSVVTVHLATILDTRRELRELMGGTGSKEEKADGILLSQSLARRSENTHTRQSDFHGSHHHP